MVVYRTNNTYYLQYLMFQLIMYFTLTLVEDLERHDGTPEKPYYMSKDLMNILGKKNLVPKPLVNQRPSSCC